MATRQYIGARYVPKFFSGEGGSTEWVEGVAYEPLTIVTHLGNSYTSKKPVPVGVNILNTEYWASTGLWNTQVEQYKEEVEALKKNSVIKPQGSKILLIGDSYAVSTVVTPTWQDVVVNYLGLTSDEYQKFGYGARGFAGTYKFIDSLMSDIDNITNKNEITNIYVCGGANDVGQSKSDLKTAISNFKAYCLTQFPNATLHIGFIGWSRLATSSWKTTYNYYKTICAELGIPYLKGVEVPLHNFSFLQNTENNYHHPNADGSNALGLAIAGAMVNGSFDYEDSDSIAITATGTHLMPGAHFDYEVKNGILKLWFNIVVYGNTGGSEAGITELPANTAVLVGTISNNNWIGITANEDAKTTIHGIGLFSSGSHAQPFDVMIINNNVYVRNMGPTISAGVGGAIRCFAVTRDVMDNYA